ncbi:hypothetical protein EON62_01010 [archaeon]|nr:MAG: hypothetical protein EON62_01010 [archaeon]
MTFARQLRSVRTFTSSMGLPSLCSFSRRTKYLLSGVQNMSGFASTPRSVNVRFLSPVRVSHTAASIAPMPPAPAVVLRPHVNTKRSSGENTTSEQL